MTHLDTNFLIDALISGSAQDATLVAWLAAGEDLGVSAVAWGEFLCGPMTPSAEIAARRLLPVAVPLDRSSAENAARLFNLSGRRNRSFNDCCVAAIAMASGAALATSNRADFLPLVPHGLTLV